MHEVKTSKPDYKLTVNKKQTTNQMIEEEPEKITAQNMCFWFEKKGYLLGSKKNKAKKFVKLNCISKIKETQFECAPVPGYNKTTYTITKENNCFSCTCQAFKRNQQRCSHIMAVQLKLFMGRWNNGQR